ncbi:MAG: hypothetical protein WEC75_08630 [Dehalococcoidia bacterium]
MTTEQGSATLAQSALALIVLTLVFVSGIGLLAFASFVAFRDGFANALVVLYMLGILCLAGTLVALNMVGSLTVKHNDTEVKLEQPRPRPASSNPNVEAAPGTAEPERRRDDSASEAATAAAPTDGGKSLFSEAIDAWANHDYASFDLKMIAYIEQQQEGDKATFDAFRLSWLYEAGQGRRLQELHALRRDNPSAPAVLLRLAEAYMFTDQPKVALDLYEQGAALSGLSVDHRREILTGQVRARIKLKEYEASEGRLRVAELEDPAPQWQHSIHKLFAEVYDAWDDQVRKHWHLEQAGGGESRRPLYTVRPGLQLWTFRRQPLVSVPLRDLTPPTRLRHGDK